MRLTCDDRPTTTPAGHIDIVLCDEADDAPALVTARTGCPTRSRRLAPELLDALAAMDPSLSMRVYALAVGGTRIVRRGGVAVAEHVPGDTRAAIFWLEN